MKVTLISPFPDLQSFGLRTLSSCLKEDGHHVEMFFLKEEFYRRFSRRVVDDLLYLVKDSDLIGVSLMTNFFDNGVQITEEIRNKLGKPVIWGGVHAMVRPEESLKHADMVCTGEGEEAIVEVAAKMARGEDYTSTTSMWFNGNDGIIKNDLKSLYRELDDIPYPYYEYKNHFVLDEGRLHRMDLELVAKHTQDVYMTMPTRGCPYSCTFCCNNTFNRMWKGEKPVRARSNENIIRELKWVRENFPFIKLIKFDDDAFFMLPDEIIEEFSRDYRREIGLPLLVTGATPSTLTHRKLSALVDAGLYSMRMGIQSANEQMKKEYRRYHPQHRVSRAMHIVKEFVGVLGTPHYDIILDNPWERIDSKVETIRFMAAQPAPYILTLFSLTFYPGTDLYDRAVADGMIWDDHEQIYRKHYHGVKYNYINRLFFLLSDYSEYNIGINSRFMHFLTTNFMRKSALGWPLVFGMRSFIEVYMFLHDFRGKHLPGFKWYLKRKLDVLMGRNTVRQPEASLQVD